MKYTLTKLSQPGWERDFYDKPSLQHHLFLHICPGCRSEEQITETSSISDMLATACGCEFSYDEEEL
jgi:hypothetical protein